MSTDVHIGDRQGLDRTRRYLRPVARLPLKGQPNDTHWAVYEWLPQFEAWATGPGLCGYSTRQGPLPEGTAVTCQHCLVLQPRYEQMLAPECGDQAVTARINALREVKDRIKTEALVTDSEARFQALVWLAGLLDEMAATEPIANDFLAGQAQGPTPPTEGDQMT